MHQVLRAQAVGGGLDEPTTVGLATNHFQLDRGHAGDGPTACRYGPLLKPQATEPGWNGRDQWLAHRPATPQDDAESIASRGSGPSRGLASAPPPHDRMILPARWGRGPFEPARLSGRNHHGPLHRGIEPPLEAQRRNASSGATLHQVLGAPDARPSLDEPSPFGLARKHLHLDRGHAGDGPTAYRYCPLLKPQATE